MQVNSLCACSHSEAMKGSSSLRLLILSRLLASPVWAQLTLTDHLGGPVLLPPKWPPFPQGPRTLPYWGPEHFIPHVHADFHATCPCCMNMCEHEREHEHECEREQEHKNGAEHSRKMNVKSKMNTDLEIFPPEQLQLDNSDKSLGSFRCTRIIIQIHWTSERADICYSEHWLSRQNEKSWLKGSSLKKLHIHITGIF
jgi:hypothetical protein